MAARSPGPPNRERRVVVQAVRKVVKPHSVDRATTTLWRDAERSLGQQRFEWSGEWVGSLRPAEGSQPARMYARSASEASVHASWREKKYSTRSFRGRTRLKSLTSRVITASTLAGWKRNL